MRLYELREPKCFITSSKHACPLFQTHSIIQAYSPCKQGKPVPSLTRETHGELLPSCRQVSHRQRDRERK